METMQAGIAYGSIGNFGYFSFGIKAMRIMWKSPNIVDSRSSLIRVHYDDDKMIMAIMEPIHPGEILREEFLKPLKIAEHRLAQDIRVRQSRVNAILNGEKSVTADIALRLGRYFGISPEFWFNLQMRYDFAAQKDMLGDRLERDVRVLRHAVEIPKYKPVKK